MKKTQHIRLIPFTFTICPKKQKKYSSKFDQIVADWFNRQDTNSALTCFDDDHAFRLFCDNQTKNVLKPF